MLQCFDAEAEPLEAAGGLRMSDTAEMTKQIRWFKDQASARDDIAERLERIDEELESLTDFRNKLAGAQDKLVDFLKDMSASMVKLAASVEKIADAYDRFGAGISKLAEIEQRRIEAAAAPAQAPGPLAAMFEGLTPQAPPAKPKPKPKSKPELKLVHKPPKPET
jgi:hypothetical protein